MYVSSLRIFCRATGVVVATLYIDQAFCDIWQEAHIFRTLSVQNNSVTFYSKYYKNINPFIYVYFGIIIKDRLCNRSG